MRTLIVIPTYNEVGSLAGVVEQALAADPTLELLVVDDGSPDGTGQLADRLAAAERRVHVLHRPAKTGLGSAYRDGFAWAFAHAYEAIGEMDADASHDPADLPRLVAALHDADLVIGSRYVPGGKVANWPRRRLVLSRGANRYVRIATGLPVADSTSGFRLFRRAALEQLHPSRLRSEGYAFQIETALRAWQAGAVVVEVPITFVERREGASKLSRRIILEALWRVARWGVAERAARQRSASRR
jgi:dolichol-phosphate mannosyltransferase